VNLSWITLRERPEKYLNTLPLYSTKWPSFAILVWMKIKYGSIVTVILLVTSKLLRGLYEKV